MYILASRREDQTNRDISASKFSDAPGNDNGMSSILLLYAAQASRSALYPSVIITNAMIC